MSKETQTKAYAVLGVATMIALATFVSVSAVEAFVKSLKRKKLQFDKCRVKDSYPLDADGNIDFFGENDLPNVAKNLQRKVDERYDQQKAEAAKNTTANGANLSPEERARRAEMVDNMFRTVYGVDPMSLKPSKTTLPPGINAKGMEKDAQELVNLFDSPADVSFSPTGCSAKCKPRKKNATTADTAHVHTDRGYNERDGE